MRPGPSGPAGSELLYAGLSCVVDEGHRAVYVSSPITTGHALLDWHASGQVGNYRDRVIGTNIARARAVVRLVRSKFEQPVIDPTSLPDVPDWVQVDYHAFWVGVIERFVQTIVFVDGWESSTGAVIEYAAGKRLGLTLLDQHLEPIAHDAAISRVESTMRALENLGLDPSNIAAVLDELVV